MRPRPRRRSMTLLRRVILASALAVVGAVAFAPAALASLTTAQHNEQVRYAWETDSLTYDAFMARKADFTANGCNSDRPKAWVCWQRKPVPYDAFLWTTDGCSVPGLKRPFTTLFAGPCEQHDFGYRNIGKGLMLDRSISARKRIDKKLYEEAKRVCRNKFSGVLKRPLFTACMDAADGMYSFFLLPTSKPPFGPENWNKPCAPGACWPPQIVDTVPIYVPPFQQPLPIIDTGGGSGGGGGGGGGSTPPPGPSGVTETAGGVVHTWTDPSSAGGTQGPSIASGQSVVIACKLQGFRVANGNSWWYKIASSPWNGTYYASADAFYNNGATSGPLAGTPYMDPAVPDCGSAAPPVTSTPSGAVTETVGGVTHTWTNPANAGGTQGPSIQTGQSVGIACKLQGFRVADGNTWWYKIASAPWNGSYYASADAFYNNGATSGSLIGTPFVDTRVPDCVSAPPPPPAPTWGETAGGVAHTWTNPANAGGTQGPSIAGGQTVQISCRLQGFRVADGNTWWYRIAQAPWNNAYYVSADAFYNNGATSGSLIGTPFVDPAVAGC